MQHDRIPVVREFMTQVVITVAPDTGIYEAIRLLLDHRISGAPVVEKHGDSNAKVVGIITEKDCLSILTSGAFFGPKGGIVSDFMSSPVITTRADVGLFALANKFLKNPYRRLPVIDDDDDLLGIVSRRDVLVACREIWGDDIRVPDSGYLTDAVKAKLGKDGVTKLHRRTQF